MLDAESLKLLRQIRTALVVLAASGCVISLALTLPLLVTLVEWIAADVGRTASAVAVGIVGAIPICCLLLSNLAKPNGVASDAI